MIGAIIGDIVGSRFEFNNYRKKDFELFTNECFVTDDSIMTIAVAKAVKECLDNKNELSTKVVKYMQELGRPYPDCGFGGRFYGWIYSDNPKPYNSFGNGAAMRVSACGELGRSVEEVKELSKLVTEVSHNHPEGLKGAEATAVCIYLARFGKDKKFIKNYIEKHYYSLNFTIDEIRQTYRFNETCQNTVPQALAAFFESDSFEDAIRNAISIGGDSDTIGAIVGSIAEAYYGVEEEMIRTALTYLDKNLINLYNDLIK